MRDTAHTDRPVTYIVISHTGETIMTTRNKLHYPGVRWARSRKRYEASIPVVLGYYSSENAAYMARGEVRKVLIRTGHRDMLTTTPIPTMRERRSVVRQ